MRSHPLAARSRLASLAADDDGGTASRDPWVVPPPRPPAPPPQGAPAPPPVDVPEWLQPVVAEVRRGNKIGAIKAYRAATGVGLSEAKDTVEGLERQLAAPVAPSAPPAPTTCSTPRASPTIACSS